MKIKGKLNNIIQTSKRQKANFGSDNIDTGVDGLSTTSYYGLIHKNTEMLSKIEQQKVKNKQLRDKIAKLKEAKRQKVEFEKNSNNDKQTESSKYCFLHV